MAVVRPLLCVALVASASCFGATEARAESSGLTSARAPPWIEGFDLERVESLRPGVPLNFILYGSPGAAVTLSIEGGRHLFDLPETRPGLYEGTYVLSEVDHIRPDSRIVASVQRNGMVSHSTLTVPLLVERNSLPWAGLLPHEAAGAPFPRAGAPATRVPAGDTAAYDDRSSVGAGTEPATLPPTRLRPRCGDCAVIESIHVVKVPPRAGWLGAGGGSGQGGIEGARRERYEVLLRLADGTALLRIYEQAPPFHPGDSISLPGRFGATLY
jgi:hypothetical protein